MLVNVNKIDEVEYMRYIYFFIYSRLWIIIIIWKKIIMINTSYNIYFDKLIQYLF